MTSVTRLFTFGGKERKLYVATVGRQVAALALSCFILVRGDLSERREMLPSSCAISLIILSLQSNQLASQPDRLTDGDDLSPPNSFPDSAH